MSDSEPYRYSCPLCGSRRVYRVQGCQRPRGKTYSVGRGGAVAAATDRERTFACRSCGKRLPHLYDRQELELASPIDP